MKVKKNVKTDQDFSFKLMTVLFIKRFIKLIKFK